MAETAQTMTEFTYAPGEKNIVGDRFSPSVIIFWLKTSIAASSTRVQYKAPNTLFGLIPLGASTKTIPLRNIASVDTNTRFNLGSLVWGLIFLFVGFGMFDSNALVAIVCLLVAVANFANVMSATLTFHDPSGGANAITVSILEKDKLMSLAQEIQTRVFTDADQLRHEESREAVHRADQQRAHPAADARQPAGAGRATGSGRRLTAGKRVTVKTEHGLGRMLPDPSVYRITKTGNPDKDVARIPI